MRDTGVRFRELECSAAGISSLRRFYRGLYVREFPHPDERESLSNMQRYLRLKAQGWYGRNTYHIVVAEVDGRPIGGAVFDFLSAPNAGVIEFLFIAAKHRGRGFGKALLDETTRLLAADSQRLLGKSLGALVAEMNDPFTPGSVPDNLDPFERCAMWGKWGFNRMLFPYVQPALSRRQRPVDCLVLIAKRLDDRSATACAGAWVASVLREYMRWAMRIPNPQRNREYRGMAAYLSRHAEVPLIPLQAYVGRDAAPALHVREVKAPGRLFSEVLDVLARNLDNPALIVSPATFRRALASRRSRKFAYHLWALRSAPSAPIQGMASFFAMNPAGFGGYIVLAAKLKGKGLLRSVIARIEEAMIRDRPHSKGWFIECTARSSAAFRKCGFAEVPISYRPPALHGQERRERLQLLYKPFGMPCRTPALERAFVLKALESILSVVYGIRAPRKDPCYAGAISGRRG